MADMFPFFAGFSSASRNPGVLLFDEDFDLPPPAPEPEVIQPTFTAAELTAAREEAARDSRDLALAESDGSARAATNSALAEIATQLAAGRADAASIAEQSAEAIARLLLGCFATAFPVLCARHGAGELAAVLRELLPALHRESRIVVRINPQLVPAMTEEIKSLDPDLAAHVRLVPAAAMASGDARITWENGVATRDAASLWTQIENILAPVGLLPIKTLSTGQTVKEHELVE
jgi:flagellar biosynthesis/type III secretory pathway protein FliH